MLKITDKKRTTALLVIDPYSDFISKGGKVWDRLKRVAEVNQVFQRLCQHRSGSAAQETRHS